MAIYTAPSPQDMLTEACSAILGHQVYGGSKRAQEAIRARHAYERIPRHQRAHLRAAEHYALRGDRGHYMMELVKLENDN